MSTFISRLQHFFAEQIWIADRGPLPEGRRLLIRSLQVLYALLRRIQEGDLNLRSMSLVYTTLLSIVPLLAVSFSVLKAFEVHSQIQPFLENLLEPLGDKSIEITARLIGFVENMKVGVLGSLGLAMLFYTVYSLLQKVETSFNSIWHNTRPRTLSRRFADYLSVVLVGPVLVFSGLGVTASMTNTEFVQRLVSIEPFGSLYYFLGVLMPYVLIICAFFFAYSLIPNTRVKAKAAFVGALVAGILWKTAGWAMAVFVAGSTKYDAIYSGFAILLIFIIWLQLSWLILLLGAQISFYVQHPQYVRFKSGTPYLGNRDRERLGLAVMYVVAQRFHAGEAAPNADQLADTLDVPSTTIEEVVAILIQHGLLAEKEGDAAGYLPGRDIETLSLRSIREALRDGPLHLACLVPLSHSTWPSDSVIDELRRACNDALGERTLKDLLRSQH
jgi:membrane protein